MYVMMVRSQLSSRLFTLSCVRTRIASSRHDHHMNNAYSFDSLTTFYSERTQNLSEHVCEDLLVN